MAANSGKILTAIARRVDIFLVSSACLNGSISIILFNLLISRGYVNSNNDFRQMCHAEEKVKRKASVIREQGTLLQVTYELYETSKGYDFQAFCRKMSGEHRARCGWEFQCMGMKRVQTCALTRYWLFIKQVCVIIQAYRSNASGNALSKVAMLETIFTRQCYRS